MSGMMRYYRCYKRRSLEYASRDLQGVYDIYMNRPDKRNVYMVHTTPTYRANTMLVPTDKAVAFLLALVARMKEEEV